MWNLKSGPSCGWGMGRARDSSSIVLPLKIIKLSLTAHNGCTLRPVPQMHKHMEMDQGSRDIYMPGLKMQVTTSLHCGGHPQPDPHYPGSLHIEWCQVWSLHSGNDYSERWKMYSVPQVSGDPVLPSATFQHPSSAVLLQESKQPIIWHSNVNNCCLILSNILKLTNIKSNILSHSNDRNATSPTQGKVTVIYYCLCLQTMK